MSLHLRLVLLASVVLGFLSAGKAEAVCLNSCRNHCIGRCTCIAHRNPDCNCNIFACNCDCCKTTFCSGPGPCWCQNSSTEPSAPTSEAPICNCGSRCCRSDETSKPAEGPAERFARIDTGHDGAISFEETVEHLKGDPELNLLLRAFTAEEMQARYFTPLDKNSNGVLEPEEFDRDLAGSRPTAGGNGSAPS